MKTIIKKIDNDTILISNLYFDVLNNNFLINNHEYNYEQLYNYKWKSRDDYPTCDNTFIIEDINDYLKHQNEDDFSIKIITSKNMFPTIVLARRFAPDNWGHLFSETIIPIEYVFNKLNINNFSDRAVIIDDDVSSNADIQNSIFPKNYDDKLREQTQIFSNNTTISLAEIVIFGFKTYVNNYIDNKNRFIRIENQVLFGIGGISPFVTSDLWNDKYMKNVLDNYLNRTYQIYFPNINIKNMPQDTLTFIIKKGIRSVANYEEVSILLSNFAKYKNLKYRAINLSDISYTEQLSIMMRTKILFTNSGSSSFCGLLIPKKIILVYFPLDSNKDIPERRILVDLKYKYNLFEYNDYDTNWNLTQIDSNNSYNVNLDILKIILQKILEIKNI